MYEINNTIQVVAMNTHKKDICIEEIIKTPLEDETGKSCLLPSQLLRQKGKVVTNMS